ncbi:hypothetical protein L6164_016817 [Bauhinia variegata]|uniref:Uncharacterized protein n=1 Tax=Bauhinia variegata TaxID=167791 RepID=A0ACB9N7W6_BAUVA|nr:hypothetical protein L6164_016817 [Bauhinia variegata]
MILQQQEDILVRHAEALKEVNHVLRNREMENAIEGLSMIDYIQRLGMQYQFEEEIEAILKRQQLMFRPQVYCGNDDLELSEVALKFRLLRQEGYWAHANVFDNFMDNEGKLKEKFWGNIEGLMGLFEASQFSIEGESRLDEAGKLSHQLLDAWKSRFHGKPQAKAIANTLQYPIHKCLPKLMPSKLQLPTFGWTNSLEELSKLDTEINSTLKSEEILQVSRWWQQLGMAKDLKFARDEPRRWHMWAIACLPDPRFSDERIELTKPWSFVHIIDDIFDIYGTIEELTLFTDAINRWDLAAVEPLPDYMKACFKALYEITDELAYKVQIKHGWNPRDSLIKSWMMLCNAFLVEAKWLASGHLPKAEKYLKNGIVSSAVQLYLVHAFSLMAAILRLCDDLEGIKDDNQHEKDGSYLKCYMKDHPEVSAEQTTELINQMISDAWKSLNKDCLRIPTNPFPSSFAKICANFSKRRGAYGVSICSVEDWFNGFSHLKDICPAKDSQKIKLRVGRIWSVTSNDANGPHLIAINMILMDELSDKIQASPYRCDLVARYKTHVHEEECYVIESFSVCENSGDHKATRHHDTSMLAKNPSLW